MVAHFAAQKRRESQRNKKANRRELDSIDICCIKIGAKFGLGEVTRSAILDEEDGTPHPMDLSNESEVAISLQREAM